MAFTIEFQGFSPESADTTGYNAHDFLPGYADQEFATRNAAYDFIRENYKGADCDGVTAKFIVVE